jgi:hypothetical protein
VVAQPKASERAIVVLFNFFVDSMLVKPVKKMIEMMEPFQASPRIVQ